MFNWLAILGAAFVPMVLGFIWYHPSIFGKAWMKAAGVSDERPSGGKMAMIFGISFLLSFMLAIEMNFVVIHQSHLKSIVMNEPGVQQGDNTAEAMIWYNSSMEKYGKCFRNFHHGVIHGIIASLFFILPVMGTNALFERKGFKYILINVGYWTVCLAIMGGIVCKFI